MTTHKIVAGDTLSALAQRYYGNASHWPLIYSANATAIHAAQRFGSTRRALCAGKPPEDWIFPGTVLTMPALT